VNETRALVICDRFVECEAGAQFGSGKAATMVSPVVGSAITRRTSPSPELESLARAATRRARTRKIVRSAPGCRGVDAVRRRGRPARCTSAGIVVTYGRAEAHRP